jgi:hypothetical protein
MTEKYLRAAGLTNADISVQKYTSYIEEVGADVAYEDVFHPSFWRHHKKLRRHDVIRLVHPRGDFDIYVTVRAVVGGGVVVDYHGGRPPEGVDSYAVARDELSAAMKIRPVPIAADGKPAVFIEHLPKTKWRVIGLNRTEIKRDIATQEEAQIEMSLYLNEIRMRLPTPEEILAELQLRERLMLAAEAEVEAQAKPKTEATA